MNSDIIVDLRLASNQKSAKAIANVTFDTAHGELSIERLRVIHRLKRLLGIKLFFIFIQDSFGYRFCQSRTRFNYWQVDKFSGLSAFKINGWKSYPWILAVLLNNS
jgi:hypothetical protein